MQLLTWSILKSKCDQTLYPSIPVIEEAIRVKVTEGSRVIYIRKIFYVAHFGSKTFNNFLSCEINKVKYLTE